MNKRVNPVRQLKGILPDPRWLLVIYSLFDIVWAWLRVQRLVAEAVAAEINLMRSDLDLMADSFLLLAAAVGLRLGSLWSYLAAIIAGGWLLWRGITKWEAIALAHFPEIPMWSGACLKYWWMYGGAEWDFPRFILAGLIIIYATTALIRCSAYNNSLDKRPRAVLK